MAGASNDDDPAAVLVDPSFEAQVFVDGRDVAVADLEDGGHARARGEPLSAPEQLVEERRHPAAVYAVGRAFVGTSQSRPALDDSLTIRALDELDRHRRGDGVEPAADGALVEVGAVFSGEHRGVALVPADAPRAVEPLAQRPGELRGGAEIVIRDVALREVGHDGSQIIGHRRGQSAPLLTAAALLGHGFFLRSAGGRCPGGGQ